VTVAEGVVSTTVADVSPGGADGIAGTMENEAEGAG
jgi:hypothetical protein